MELLLSFAKVALLKPTNATNALSIRTGKKSCSQCLGVKYDVTNRPKNVSQFLCITGMLQKDVMSLFRMTEIMVATRSFGSLIIDALDVKGVSQITMLVILHVSDIEDHDRSTTEL